MKKKEYYTSDFKEFHVTGLLYCSNKRFKLIYRGGYRGYAVANGINLWKGSVWGVLKSTGKRVLLKRVSN